MMVHLKYIPYSNGIENHFLATFLNEGLNYTVKFNGIPFRQTGNSKRNRLAINEFE